MVQSVKLALRYVASNVPWKWDVASQYFIVFDIQTGENNMAISRFALLLKINE